MMKPVQSTVGCWISLCAGLLLATPALAAHSQKPTLQYTLTQLADKAKPGVLGIAVIDLTTREASRVNASRAYPMMSVFKAPVAAAVLAQVDAGHLALTQKVTINRDDVVNGSAVPSIGTRFQGTHMQFTVEQLLVAAVSESDNTAVDALLRLLGDPRVVTDYLVAHGINGMRVDISEGQVSRIFEDTANGPSVPAHETDDEALKRRQRGYRAYLDDPRNRSTPDAAALFLEKLRTGKLLSPSSTKHLVDLMIRQTAPARLRAGLPAGIRFADKCGTSYTLESKTAAFNDIGIMSWPDGHTVIVAAFLTDSRADKAARDALFAEIGRAVADAYPASQPKP